METLLYYRRVHIILDVGLLGGLLQIVGINGVHRLLGMPGVTSDVVPDILAIYSDGPTYLRRHRRVTMRHAGRDGARINPSDTIGIISAHFRNTSKLGEISRRQLTSLLSASHRTSLDKITGHEAGAEALFNSLANDVPTIKLFALHVGAQRGLAVNKGALDKATLIVNGPAGPDKDFNVISDTSFDLIAPSAGDQTLSWADVLSSISDYAAEIYLSQARSSDLICSTEIGSLADERIDISLQRAEKNRRPVSALEEQLIGGAHLFGDAINDGRLSFEDAMRVIDRTSKFRTWTADLAPDASLIEEYHAKMAEDPLASKLPAKIARFAFFTGGGLLASTVLSPAAAIPGSLALAGFDMFVIDKLVKGWRPNTFTGTLKAALKT